MLMTKLMKTSDSIIAIQDREGGKEKCGYSDALGMFRNELYADFPINIVTLPEIAYDPKTNRYILKFSVKGIKHSLKCSDEIAAFIAGNLNLSGQIYYGFKMTDGIVSDAVAEVW